MTMLELYRAKRQIETQNMDFYPFVHRGDLNAAFNAERHTWEEVEPITETGTGDKYSVIRITVNGDPLRFATDYQKPGIMPEKIYINRL